MPKFEEYNEATQLQDSDFFLTKLRYKKIFLKGCSVFTSIIFLCIFYVFSYFIPVIILL